MQRDWQTRYEVAVEAARAAGDLARTYYDGTFDVESKPDSSPVTIADRRGEEAIRELVARHFPDDGFLGEEYGDRPGGSGFRWVIDPIDGTRSFVRHVPIWGTLVGLEYRGEPVAGVAYVPVLGMTYRALRGGGAFVNDRPIRVTAVDRLADAHLCYSSVDWFVKVGKEAAFLELVRRTQRQRGFGDFYGFCLLAEGACDIMLDHGVHEWDVSALRPIVEEAGGAFTDWAGTPTTRTPDVVATNGTLHADVLALLR